MPKTIVFKDIPEDGFFLSENNESNLTLYRKWKNWGHVFDVVDNRIINICRIQGPIYTLLSGDTRVVFET